MELDAISILLVQHLFPVIFNPYILLKAELCRPLQNEQKKLLLFLTYPSALSPTLL